jgi:hypothetical protein
MSSAGGEEDKKPAGGEGGIHINLKVKGQVCTLPPFHPPLTLPRLPSSCTTRVYVIASI